MRHRPALAALLLGLAGPAAAADPAPSPIVPSPVMGDTSRSGPDGWVQAPITRDQAGQGRTSSTQPLNARPQDVRAPNLPPGQDPGTPTTAASAGPGSADTATRKP